MPRIILLWQRVQNCASLLCVQSDIWPDFLLAAGLGSHVHGIEPFECEAEATTSDKSGAAEFVADGIL